MHDGSRGVQHALGLLAIIQRANNGLIGNSHGMIRQRSPHAGPYRSAHVVKHFGGGAIPAGIAAPGRGHA